MGGNPIQFDYSVLLSVMFPLLFCLIFFIVTIYFMVSALRYFKHKERADSELLERLDMLIKIQTLQSEKKL